MDIQSPSKSYDREHYYIQEVSVMTTENRSAADCDRKLMEILYDMDLPSRGIYSAAAQDRLKAELNYYQESGFSETLLVLERAAKIADEADQPWVTFGLINDSLVAYLLGITDVNPLSGEDQGYDLPFELISDRGTDKPPTVEIRCSRDIYLRLLEEGIGNTDPIIKVIPSVMLSCAASFGSLHHSGISAGHLYQIWHELYLAEETSYWSFAENLATTAVTPKNFRELVAAFCLAYGTGIPIRDREALESEHLQITETVYSRQSVYRKLSRLRGMTRTAAASYANHIAGGRFTTQIRDELTSYGLEPWYLDECGQARYLFSEGHVISHLKSKLLLAEKCFLSAELMQSLVDNAKGI